MSVEDNITQRKRNRLVWITSLEERKEQEIEYNLDYYFDMLIRKDDNLYHQIIENGRYHEFIKKTLDSFAIDLYPTIGYYLHKADLPIPIAYESEGRVKISD